MKVAPTDLTGTNANWQGFCLFESIDHVDAVTDEIIDTANSRE